MSRLKPPPKPPHITTLKEAEAIGLALAKYSPIDARWAPQVFLNDLSFTRRMGPEVLNAELEAMWEMTLTSTEKIAIMTEYVAARLDQ